MEQNENKNEKKWYKQANKIIERERERYVRNRLNRGSDLGYIKIDSDSERLHSIQR